MLKLMVTFSLVHIKHLNPLKTHPERVAKADRQINNSLELW